MGHPSTVFAQLSGDDFARIPNDQLRLAALCFAAETCRSVGTDEAARTLYRLLQAHEPFAASVSVFSIGSVARSLGVLALQVGSLDDAERHLQHAVELDARSPAWTATALVDLAECYLTRAGPANRRAAAEILDRARDHVKGLGACRVERRIRAISGHTV